MGWSALLKADLDSLLKSWVFRGWAVALALSAIVEMIAALASSRGAIPPPASLALAQQLDGFLVLWSTVIIVICAGAVSGDAGMASDSILCRACNRHQYILAKFASRALLILGVYLVVAATTGFIAGRYGANDLTLASAATGIGIVGLALLMLVALSVLASVIFNNTIVSLVSMLLLWYVASQIFSFAGAPYLSPSSLVYNLPVILRDTTPPQVTKCVVTPTSLTLAFSKPMDRASAEIPSNYAISANGAAVAPKTVLYDSSRENVIFAGLSFKPGDKVKAQVLEATDSAGNRISPSADRASATLPGASSKKSGEDKSAVAVKKTIGSETRSVSVIRCEADRRTLRIFFSDAINAKDAEKTENYIVESPFGTKRAPTLATYDPGSHSVLLAGLNLPDGLPVKATASRIRDAKGSPLSLSANGAVYSEVTNWKYALGFGLPALLAVLLSMVWYSRADL